MKAEWVYRPEVNAAVYETEYASGSVEIVNPTGWRAEVWCLLSMNQVWCEDFATLAKARAAVEKLVDEITPQDGKD